MWRAGRGAKRVSFAAGVRGLARRGSQERPKVKDNLVPAILGRGNRTFDPQPVVPGMAGTTGFIFTTPGKDEIMANRPWKRPSRPPAGLDF
jgi:hypothetical protein